MHIILFTVVNGSCQCLDIVGVTATNVYCAFALVEINLLVLQCMSLSLLLEDFCAYK